MWITNGGGGTFADIWTPDTFAQAGLYISDTSTPGHVYQLSSEHHVRNEVKLKRVSNWELFAVQTEEERGESPFALPLAIDHSHNITIANYFGYRVISSYQPFPYAIRVSESSGIRFRNVHIYSNSKVPLDNSVFDQTHHFQVRRREFASLDITEAPPEGNSVPLPPRCRTGFEAEKAGGAFAHFSRAVRRGAKRIESVSDLKDVAHVAFAHPDGANTAVLTNTGAPRRVSVRIAGHEAEVDLPGDSLVTLSWKA